MAVRNIGSVGRRPLMGEEDGRLKGPLTGVVLVRIHVLAREVTPDDQESIYDHVDFIKSASCDARAEAESPKFALSPAGQRLAAEVAARLQTLVQAYIDAKGEGRSGQQWIDGHFLPGLRATVAFIDGWRPDS